MVGGEEAVAVASRVFPQHFAEGKVIGGVIDRVGTGRIGPEEDASVAQVIMKIKGQRRGDRPGGQRAAGDGVEVGVGGVVVFLGVGQDGGHQQLGVFAPVFEEIMGGSAVVRSCVGDLDGLVV